MSFEVTDPKDIVLEAAPNWDYNDATFSTRG